MPLFGQSSSQKFTPKELKFSTLYKYGAKGKLTSSVKDQAKRALTKAGYDQEKIGKIVTGDKGVSVQEMKRVATALNKERVYGFTKSPQALVKTYLVKERVKKQNIALIRKENMMEARKDDVSGATPVGGKKIGSTSRFGSPPNRFSSANRSSSTSFTPRTSSLGSGGFNRFGGLK
ncbi:MAG: hypothetical protein WC516_07600 [Patescibacteria group bacterium]